MNINFNAPIGKLGYGYVGYNILKHLVINNHQVSLFPIGNIDADDQSDSEWLRECVINQNHYDVLAPSIKLWHQHSLAERIGRGRWIGFPIFELNQFTDREKHHLSALDGILVPSQWAKNIIEQNNITCPVAVVPMGVDRIIFFEPNSVPDDGDIIFINIGKWEVRKGHDLLIEAFNLAFDISDRVQLWMVPSNPFLTQQQTDEWIKMYQNSKLKNKIKIFDRQQTQIDIANLIRRADCGVFPARAEGWNLEALEVLSCGKQLIITDYSAHTEFCTFSNSHLIPIQNLESAHDGIWFHGQGEWAHIGPSELLCLINKMRLVYDEIITNGRSINKEGILTAQYFNWTNSINKLLSAIKCIGDKIHD